MDPESLRTLITVSGTLLAGATGALVAGYVQVSRDRVTAGRAARAEFHQIRREALLEVLTGLYGAAASGMAADQNRIIAAASRKKMIDDMSTLVRLKGDARLSQVTEGILNRAIEGIAKRTESADDQIMESFEHGRERFAHARSVLRAAAAHGLYPVEAKLGNRTLSADLYEALRVTDKIENVRELSTMLFLIGGDIEELIVHELACVIAAKSGDRLPQSALALRILRDLPAACALLDAGSQQEGARLKTQEGQPDGEASPASHNRGA